MTTKIYVGEATGPVEWSAARHLDILYRNEDRVVHWPGIWIREAVLLSKSQLLSLNISTSAIAYLVQ